MAESNTKIEEKRVLPSGSLQSGCNMTNPQGKQNGEESKRKVVKVWQKDITAHKICCKTYVY